MPKQTAKSKKRGIIIAVAAVLLLVVSVILTATVFVPKSIMSNIENYIEIKDYSNAFNEAEKIAKNSQYDYYVSKISASISDDIEALVNEGKYSEALEMLTSYPTIDNYSNTHESIIFESLALNCIYELRSYFKNPNSMQVNSLTFYIFDGDALPSVVMKTSGQNGFGGYSSSYDLFTYDDTSHEYNYLGSVDSLNEDDLDDAGDQLTLLLIQTIQLGKETGEIDISRINALLSNSITPDCPDPSALEFYFAATTTPASGAISSDDDSLTDSTSAIPSDDISENIDISAEAKETENYSKIISAGSNHSVGLLSDGTVITAGGYEDHGLDAASTWENISAVSAGSYHTVGLKSDGTVVAVGQNNDGQCDVNAWSKIIAVSGGNNFTLGLREDGTVVLAGLIDESGVFPGVYNTSSWNNITSISAGTWHAVGLKSDDTVVAVGENDDGQCDVDAWENIIAVSAGYAYTAGLKSDGTVVIAGKIGFGKVWENGVPHNQPTYSVDSWKNVIAIAAGDEHLVGLLSDGTVVAVGRDDDGQYDGISSWDNVVAISAKDHTLALTKDGKVLATGANNYGQCDVSSWKLF